MPSLARPHISMISVISILEIEIGTLLLLRKDPAQGALLRTWIDEQILPRFEGRILPVDTNVVRRCAHLHIPDPRSDRDALIAATALVHNLTVVTSAQTQSDDTHRRPLCLRFQRASNVGWSRSGESFVGV